METIVQATKPMLVPKPPVHPFEIARVARIPITMDLAMKVMHKEGVFVSKVFMGSIFTEIDAKAKKNFKKVVKYKPLSSKQESKELYIYCKGF